MRKLRLLLGLAAALVCLGGAASANLPFAGQHYPNGSEDFLAGALPPPGIYLKTYLAMVEKDRLMTGGDKMDADFQAIARIVVPRLLWVTPYKLLGASVATHLFVPFYNADVRSDALLMDDTDRGLGDIIFSPLALGWHFSPNFHVVLAEDIYVPTGRYSADDKATQILSKNHWTFETVAAVTYLAGPVDLSAKLMYDFNTKNDDYDPDGVGPAPKDELKPGQEFHADWAVGYMGVKDWTLGAAGYYYQQVTHDEFMGDEVEGSRGRVCAAGPAFKFWPGMGKFSATFKHQWEFGARNLPEGQTSWLNLLWSF